METTKQNDKRARPGFEPGTSRTLSENHTPRPTSQVEIQLPCPASGCVCIHDWPCGPTDKASDYESGDCRFESCQGQHFWTPHENSTWDKNIAPPGGLEPPTFRLTAERASRLRHGGLMKTQMHKIQIQIVVKKPCQVGVEERIVVPHSNDF